MNLPSSGSAHLPPTGGERAATLVSAIERAVAERDDRLATELVASNLKALARAGHLPSIGRWIAGIPLSELVGESGELDRAVEHCGALLFGGQQEWVVRYGPLVEAVPSARPDLAARLFLFSAIGWATQGWVNTSESMFERALAVRPAGSIESFDELHASWRSRLLSLQGRHQEAVEVARALVGRDRLLIDDAPAISVLAGRLADAGDPAATDVAGHAVALWREGGSPPLIGMVDALCVAARVEAQRGDPHHGEDLATEALAMTAWQQTHLLTVQAMLTLAWIDDRVGRSADARTQLDNLRERVISLRLAPIVGALVPDSPANFDPARTNERAAPVLTDREASILQQLQGHRNFRQIGEVLFISRNTVKTHVKRIYRKLGATSRSEAIVQARQRGLLE